MRKTLRYTLVAAALSLAALVGGLAYAAIPDASGVVNACYRTTDGDLRVSDAACRTDETALALNTVGGRERLAVQTTCSQALDSNCVTTVTCSTGKIVLAGGFSINAADGSQLESTRTIFVQSSAPPTDAGWQVNSINRGGSGSYIQTDYAICAKTP